MALDEGLTAPLAIGIGCRRGVTAEPIVALVTRVLGDQDRTGARLFTLAVKAAEPGLRAAAERLGLPLTGLPADRLAGQTAVTIRSARVAAAVGVASVAEAAALAGAGAGSRLLVPRIAAAGVTCAVAVARGASPVLDGTPTGEPAEQDRRGDLAERSGRASV